MEARVDHFAVLYTPDIRKKSKRWYDGEVTFHTFNKRIMLYSSDKLLLHSVFLPNLTELPIDQELHLESYLVQIQEKRNSTTVDLTPILKRKRPLADIQNKRLQSSPDLDSPSSFSNRCATSPIRLGLSPRLAATMRTDTPIGRTSYASSSPSPLSRKKTLSPRLTGPYYLKWHQVASPAVSPIVHSVDSKDNIRSHISIGTLHDDAICEDDT